MRDAGLSWRGRYAMIGAKRDGAPLQPRTAADRALRDSESRFRTLFDQAAVGMCFVDLDGTFLRTNRRMCEIVGYSADELARTTCRAITSAADHEREEQYTASMLAGDLNSSTWEKRYVRKDGKPVWCNLTLTLLCDDRGLPSQFVGVVEDISERKRAVEELEHSESLLRIASRTARLGGWECDCAGDRISWSDEACAIYDMPPGSTPTLDEAMAFKSPAARAAIHVVVERCRSLGDPFDVEVEITSAKGVHRWVRLIGQRHRDAARDRLVGAIQDITDRKHAELETIRINRALKMMSGCNEVLIRATNETQLLADICRLVVDAGGYRMAWVGYARDDAQCTVEPVASAGHVDGYLAGTHITYSASDPAGQGGVGTTIRNGTTTVIEDLATDPRVALWRKPALERGYRSVIVLPLRDGSTTFGTLCLYAGDLYRPPAAELTLLGELADDLAFGIGHLRSQVEQRRIQEAVLKISAAVSVRAGTEFFERLVANMADAVGAQAAFIARYQPNEAARARTIAAFVDGRKLANFDFGTASMPCADLRPDCAHVVSSRLAERYPSCPLAALTGAEAFVGWRLDDSAGTPLAMMFVLFAKPLIAAEFATSTLKIFVARATAELERQSADARLADQASWLDRARDAIVVRGIDGRISFWNKSAERLYGWEGREACGQFLTDLLFDDARLARAATADVIAHGFWNGELRHRRKDDTLVHVESRWTIMRDANGEPRSILSIDTDITQRKAAEREIEHLAFFDTLTQLPNRLLLQQRLRAALTTCGRIGALLFIDLDNFKTLNDTLGHDKGDALLQQVALRLQGCVRTADTVARFGGDEFVVMLQDIGSSRDEAAANARAVAEKILALFHVPYQLGEYEHNSTPSIGVTVFTHEDGTDDLLKEADLAMYQAKAAGRNAIRFFDPQMLAVVTARRALEDDIRAALRAERFALAYQPQLDAAGAVIGAEALVRWNHDERGFVAPHDFIPVAEDCGLIVPLGRWILGAACAQLAAWAGRPETSHLTVSVNVSAREFRHAEFVNHVVSALWTSKADPRRLKLELTESLLVDDIATVIEKMNALQRIGVGFALDDFGTGYSSLSYLKRLPLAQLKIDQSFVRDVLVDPNDAVIARTIIALGQNLSLDVIAEGVETQAQRDFLAAHGCGAFQGYYFSRPVPVDAFEAFVAGRGARAS